VAEKVDDLIWLDRIVFALRLLNILRKTMVLLTFFGEEIWPDNVNLFPLSRDYFLFKIQAL